MIWGKTNVEVAEARKRTKGFEFAYVPRLLADGRWAWWELIKRDIQDNGFGSEYIYTVLSESVKEDQDD